MRIIFERSGGIMGSKSSLTINLDDLLLDQTGTLRRLLDKVNFFNFVISLAPPATSASHSRSDAEGVGVACFAVNFFIAEAVAHYK